MALDIEKMLVLSTGHLTQQTAEALPVDGAACDTFEPLWGPKFTREWGWMFHVPPLAENGEPDEDEGTPKDLSIVLAFARSRGCDWVMFDTDGSKIDELPAYEW